jgi:hypothetical protein
LLASSLDQLVMSIGPVGEFLMEIVHQGAKRPGGQLVLVDRQVSWMGCHGLRD